MNYKRLQESQIEAFIMLRSIRFFIVFDMIHTLIINYEVARLALSGEELATHNVIYAGSFLLLIILLITQNYIRPIKTVRLYLAYKIIVITMAVIFLVADEIIVFPPLTFVLFTLQLLIILRAVFIKRLRFPGILFIRLQTSCRNRQKVADAEKKRKRAPFTSVANEVIRKNCTHPDELDDAIFDYKTASEDELFSSSMYTADDASFHL